MSSFNWESKIGGKNSLATISTLVLGFAVSSASHKVTNFVVSLENTTSMLPLLGLIGSITCCALSAGAMMVASLCFSFQGYFATDLLTYDDYLAQSFIADRGVAQNSQINKQCLKWGTLFFGIGLACESVGAIDLGETKLNTHDSLSTSGAYLHWIKVLVFTICTISPLLASCYVLYVWHLMDGFRRRVLGLDGFVPVRGEIGCGDAMTLHASPSGVPLYAEPPSAVPLYAEPSSAVPLYAETPSAASLSANDLSTVPLYAQPSLALPNAPVVETNGAPLVGQSKWPLGQPQVGGLVVVTFPDDQNKNNKLGIICSAPDADGDCAVETFAGPPMLANINTSLYPLTAEERLHVKGKIGVLTAQLQEFHGSNGKTFWELEFIMKVIGSQEKCIVKYSDITQVELSRRES